MLLFHCYKFNHGASNRCTEQVRGEMHAAGAMRGMVVKRTDLVTVVFWPHVEPRPPLVLLWDI